MRSLLLVVFGCAVLAATWWLEQRGRGECCMHEVQPVIVPLVEEKAPSQPEPSAPVELDLRLPANTVSGEPLPEPEGSRYGVEQWFAPREQAESSVSFKSKLLMKEGVELQRDMGNYQEAIDGAEMGIEYRTP